VTVPGSPAAPSKPSVVQQGKNLLLQWTDGAAGLSPTYGYFIQIMKGDGESGMRYTFIIKLFCRLLFLIHFIQIMKL
jgi:hypothetical protein